MSRRYGSAVERNVLVVLGVMGVLAALLAVAVGISVLVHHHGKSPTHVVTVTTTR